jgi:hypothetical protein
MVMAQVDSSAGAEPKAPAAKPWVTTVEASLMTTQNAYSDSWSGGEMGSVSWAANLAASAQRQHSAKANHRNIAKLAFGQTLSQEEETKRWRVPSKSTDLIDLESMLRLTLGLAVDPFASLRLESQFRDARDQANIRALNPAVITASLGVARAFLGGKDRELISRLGLAVKERINRDEVTDTVAGTRKTFRDRNGGLEMVTDYKTPVFSGKVGYVSKLSVYKAFYYSDAWKLEGLPNADYWKAPDVNWENGLNASVSKYLMVSLAVQLLYDKEVDLRGRLKETLSLGLTYSRK